MILSEAVIEQIVTDLQPASVFDAGGALGPGVETLRARGIEVEGLVTSAPDLQQVPPAAQPYYRIGSVGERLSKHYDLIVCLEALEQLPQTEAEQAIANLCRHTDDLLFSSTPFDFKEVTHVNVQPPDYWAEQFARHGFFHDVDYDGSYLALWAMRLRRGHGGALGRVVGAYERRLWRLTQENSARRDLSIELRNELALKTQAERYQDRVQQQEQDIRLLKDQLAAWQARWSQLEASLGGRLLKRLQNFRAGLAPPRSMRDQLLENLAQRVIVRGRIAPDSATRLLPVELIAERQPLFLHQATVEIVVCVHNALDDVRQCLDSVVQHTTPPYALILVDDGSAAPTRDFLLDFAAQQHAVLIRNDLARGYGFAANQGLRAAQADYMILLNSDTIVTAEWLDRLVACCEADSRIGLIGPLSNTASWQSIPEIEDHGDWAANPLPEGMTVDEMGRLLAEYSARLYPRLPFLNGFCYGIKRAVIQQNGYLDEEHFGVGYGEEDDYTLRARKAGFQVAIADDVYVHHAQSRSYSHEKRRQLSGEASRTLVQKHGADLIDAGVALCQTDKVMQGLRARARAMLEREALVQQGRQRYAGRRILMVLPLAEPSGGGNVIFDEALIMRRMGVEVTLFNLAEYQTRFERAYPSLGFPVIYGTPEEVGKIGQRFDAVVATHNTSAEWLVPLAQSDQPPVLGYYIQGFEPYMYPPGTPDYQHALHSYSVLPNLKGFTKTDWTRLEVKKYTGVEIKPIGISVNIDLFRPRPPLDPVWPDRPVRVAAMVRPSAPYREPVFTMDLLKQMTRRYPAQVEAVIFGTSPDDPGYVGLPRDFPFTLAGVLSQRQVARLLNEVDVFLDLSSHQAMGLTALEAMACGAAVVVPQQGGATSFARHGENSLVIDTASHRACRQAVQRLIEDHALRQRLQQQALRDVCAFFPERPASNILEVLFGGPTT